MPAFVSNQPAVIFLHGFAGTSKTEVSKALYQGHHGSRTHTCVLSIPGLAHSKPVGVGGAEELSPTWVEKKEVDAPLCHRGMAMRGFKIFSQ